MTNRSNVTFKEGNGQTASYELHKAKYGKVGNVPYTFNFSKEFLHHHHLCDKCTRSFPESCYCIKGGRAIPNAGQTKRKHASEAQERIRRRNAQAPENLM